mmetsp:Transcript_61549/g.156364  ORF Transcript_61549/g.156364 Transcript_61549/m.156364 type:complete len:251 (-) Transcript_61549:855-1607(-)
MSNAEGDKIHDARRPGLVGNSRHTDSGLPHALQERSNTQAFCNRQTIGAQVKLELLPHVHFEPLQPLPVRCLALIIAQVFKVLLVRGLAAPARGLEVVVVDDLIVTVPRLSCLEILFVLVDDYPEVLHVVRAREVAAQLRHQAAARRGGGSRAQRRRPLQAVSERRMFRPRGNHGSQQGLLHCGSRACLLIKKTPYQMDQPFRIHRRIDGLRNGADNLESDLANVRALEGRTQHRHLVHHHAQTPRVSGI